MQPVNVDALKIKASPFYTFLYFQAYITYANAYPVKYQTQSRKLYAVTFTASLHQRQPLYSKKNKLQENFKSCTHFGE